MVLFTSVNLKRSLNNDDSCTRKANSSETTVLIVEDDSDLAELYANWLQKEYTVKTATSGEAALQIVDEQTDVVLLDWQMPGLSGDEVLETIRSRGADCLVAMVTSLEPTNEAVKMPFDEYIVKPVDRDELQNHVDQLVKRREYSRLHRDYFAVMSKLGLLMTYFSPSERAQSETYDQLVARRDELKAQIGAIEQEFNCSDFEAVMQGWSDSTAQ